jgi:Neuraminidase (sialidase)
MEGKMSNIERVLELTSNVNNPRNSEGSIIELRDKRLLLAYSHFYGGSEDNAPAYIAGRYSYDLGKTWDNKDTILIENEGQENIMSVTLLRLASGKLAIFYLIRNGWNDCRLYMRKSKDEGNTWGEKVCCISRDGYYVVNNDRVIQLSTGRIVVPAAYHHCSDGTFKTWSSRGVSMCFFSDDEGETWYQSKSELIANPESRSGFQEPGVIELKDGSLMMWMRTDMRSQYISYSYDQGITWSTPVPSELKSPLSPASIKRIPKTEDLLCIYNDISGRFPYPQGIRTSLGPRTPLVSALSTDEGRSWIKHKIIESDPDGWYCYTSICFIDDKVLLSYLAGKITINSDGVRVISNSLRVSRVNIDWFYE